MTERILSIQKKKELFILVYQVIRLQLLEDIKC